MKESKCLFVTIAGLPNAGKSTLINSIVGKKISVVTPKPQTTRTQIRGIIIYNDAQIVFTDSPGIFTAKTSLEKALVKSAWSAIKGDDITLLLVDVMNYKKKVIDIVKKLRGRAILVINKIDLIDRPTLKMAYEFLSILYRFEQIFMISALKNDGLFDLMNYLSEVAPVSPWLYPENQITDLSDSFIAAEITREKLFLSLYHELPYSAAIVTEQYTEKKDKSLIIKQVIFVLRNSHKKIILGKDGQNIKKLGIEARNELEQFFGRKVHLFLFIKVRCWSDRPEEYIGSV